jgi:hypothetical protein
MKKNSKNSTELKVRTNLKAGREGAASGGNRQRRGTSGR